MNAIVNELSLAGDKFMPEMHLRQPGFTYSACGPFTKNKERIKEFKETRDSRYIFITRNQIKIFFIMTWLLEILKIQIEEQLLTKRYVIKNITLLKIFNMMDVNEYLGL